MKCLREHAGTSQKTLFKTHQRVASLSAADSHRRRVFSGFARKTKTKRACRYIWVFIHAQTFVQFKTECHFSAVCMKGCLPRQENFAR